MSWNTPTDWTEIDIFELSGSAAGGPGPGFPYGMFMNMHVFRRSGTDFTPATKLSQPGNYFHTAPLRSRFHVYACDWYVDGGEGRVAEIIAHAGRVVEVFSDAGGGGDSVWPWRTEREKGPRAGRVCLETPPRTGRSRPKDGLRC